MRSVISAEATTMRPRSLARAATIVMLLFVASRVLGLVRDIVISHQFGTSRALDAYFAAFNIPDFIFNVLAGGALGSAFIPTFAAALAQNDAQRAWQLARAIITLALILLTALAALLALFAPQIVAATVARGFALDDQALTASLMQWMLITPIVFGVSGLVMGILNAHQHFALPALAPTLYNLAIIAGALFLAPTMGVYGLAAGVIAGAFLHLAIQLPWFVGRFQISDFRFQIFNLQSSIHNLQSNDVREVGRLMLPRTLGIAAVQINFLINTVLASGLSAGSIAALSYAWRVMLLPVGVIGQSLATVVFPTLSAQDARNERDDFRATFSTAFRATLYLTIPASVGLFVLGQPFVVLLFQRGEFDARSTVETAFALQFYALALFAHSGLEIVTRAFYAMHDTKTPVIIGIGAMGLNIALSIALIAPLAHGGLALANSVATILEVLILLVILQRRLGDMDTRRIVLSVARIAVASLTMGATLVMFTTVFAESSAILIAILGAAIGAAVYFAITVLLRSEEIAFVLQRVNRKS
jgi:putative peptidoglycan lipid II flippase